MLKRCFDLLLCILLLIFIAPLMIILGVLIYLFYGPPVLFKQIRPGFQALPFTIYKFRTMRDLRDEQGKLLEDEKRMTRLGQFLRRYSLDELPQLINVLKGDLSFVGPRPLLMEYLPRYSKEQARRHDVKPGVTGWAQVNGRNAISWEEKFKYDLWYVDHYGFWIDLKILWLTMLKVFKAQGISRDGYATMPEFMGSEKEADQ